MKKIVMVAMALIIACGVCCAQVSKTAIKEAKRLKKEGWTVLPGALPLENQLENAYMMEYANDIDSNSPKYIVADAQSIGGNYTAAKTAATSLAINNLSVKVHTEIYGIIMNSTSNMRFGQDQIESIAQTLEANKNLVNHSIGQAQVVLEASRQLKNGYIEVAVRIAYKVDLELEKSIVDNAIASAIAASPLASTPTPATTPAPATSYMLQEVVVTTPFDLLPMSSVLATYHNEFASFEMPDRDDSFPYALFRVNLIGTGNVIRIAKQTLQLNLGQMFQTEKMVTTYDNQILFLIPRGARTIYITCGDGCLRQQIFSGHLESNMIYEGTIEVK